MNPDLERLQTYPFQKLATLLEGVTPATQGRIVPLYIGEPRHPTPEFIKRALVDSLAGFASYPSTIGMPELREAIAAWLRRRYGLTAIDPATQVLPVTGTREALFALGQTVIDATRPDPVVVIQNPFYQIYEGAALLGGAAPRFLNNVPENGYAFDFDELPEAVWRRTQLVYVCSPSNPTGYVMTIEDWRRLFELSDRHGFVIASDECYSEIYPDESHPPLGSLEAAQQLGRSGYPRLVMFSSLSKRSNVPGMRSGFVAGDAAVIRPYLLYRTYQGCAMSPPVQLASIAAWGDEEHVVENRRLYREKFAAAIEILAPVLDVYQPEGGFYLWPATPCDDTEFTRRLYAREAVSVLPGSYLARPAQGRNPGAGRVRIALVAETAECAEAAARIRNFVESL